ncbi:MAG: hypothetical protein ACI9B2_000482 [Flavobacteriales bacterium]|jgi:hypothetical protein|tara:strand:+ start:1015 stop:1137 length:123 start_codon:yes stop_codon:yes gene_type:complete
MTITKKGVSVNEVLRQLGHNSYEPIWFMMRKAILAMGKAE